MNTGEFFPERKDLYEGIIVEISEKGLKATTMDSVAARFGMSKRTLYEIFDSKKRMITETLSYLSDCHLKIISEAFSGSETVMEAMIKISNQVGREMEEFSISFFRDMDRLYGEMRKQYNQEEEKRRQKLLAIFSKGIEQRVFRDDYNYEILIKMMDLQLEGLKRMEQLFPEGITLKEVYMTQTLTFLRGISTPKGLEILDRITSDQEKNKLQR